MYHIKDNELTSNITQHIWWIHWVMASDVPVSVTARSVEFGNISLATWIEHPVTSRISLIFDPPLPFFFVIFTIDVNACDKWKKRDGKNLDEKLKFFAIHKKIPLKSLKNNGGCASRREKAMSMIWSCSRFDYTKILLIPP